MIRTILFDLDDTLYPREAGIMDQIRTLMLRYLRTRLGLSAAEADALRRRYFQTYGTTLRGLQINHHIDPDEFLNYVHDIPLHQYLQPNPHLDAALAAIPQDKVIFTSATREHAESVLDALGIRRHFVRIIDVRDLDYLSKPHPLAYQRVCALLGVRPDQCLLVEDNARNLLPARELGMVTVLVSGDAPGDGVDYTIRRVEEIADLLDRLHRPEARSQPRGQVIAGGE